MIHSNQEDRVIKAKDTTTGPGLSWVSLQGRWELTLSLPPNSTITCLASSHLIFFLEQKTFLMHILSLQCQLSYEKLTVTVFT